jgi:hypothetical protein
MSLLESYKSKGLLFNSNFLEATYIELKSYKPKYPCVALDEALDAVVDIVREG